MHILLGRIFLRSQHQQHLWSRKRGCSGSPSPHESQTHSREGKTLAAFLCPKPAYDTMAASNVGGGGGGVAPGPMSAEAEAALGEAIRLVFGRWTALQMAVENQWGGRDSRAKADQFGESIFSWFCRTKGPHYFEDLVDMMYDTISDYFNSDFEDNSVEEVAEELLIIHEECLQNNYSSIEKLRKSSVQGNAVSQSRQLVADDDDDSDSSDDGDDTSMMEDGEAPPEDMAVDRPRPSRPTPDADGWTVVPPRRGGRGRT